MSRNFVCFMEGGVSGRRFLSEKRSIIIFISNIPEYTKEVSRDSCLHSEHLLLLPVGRIVLCCPRGKRLLISSSTAKNTATISERVREFSKSERRLLLPFPLRNENISENFELTDTILTDTISVKHSFGGGSLLFPLPTAAIYALKSSSGSWILVYVISTGTASGGLHR